MKARFCLTQAPDRDWCGKRWQVKAERPARTDNTLPIAELLSPEIPMLRDATDMDGVDVCSWQPYF